MEALQALETFAPAELDFAPFGDMYSQALFHLVGDDEGDNRSWRDRRRDWYNRWTTRWQTCNAFCAVYLLVNLSTLIAHWLFMLVPMRGWAEGNLILVLLTMTTTMKAQASMMLMVGEPVWMMAPKWQRMMMYILSLISVFTFLGQFVAWTKAYFQGNTPLDSFNEVITAYIMVLRFGDLIPSLYIFLFEGLGQSRYALFNKDYGNWDDVIIEPDNDRLIAEQTAGQLAF